MHINIFLVQEDLLYKKAWLKKKKRAILIVLKNSSHNIFSLKWSNTF